MPRARPRPRPRPRPPTSSGSDNITSGTALCDAAALATSRLQPGNGGPDAKKAVSCDAGYALCRIDPNGKDNDVCSDPTDCYACSKPAVPPATVPTCADDALGTSHLQPGAAGGPDARKAVACTAGFTLCKIDPRGKDNDVCSDPTDCYACAK